MSAIVGPDRKWYWAEAKKSGNKIILSSSKVSKLSATRYAWAMTTYQRNLTYNREGIVFRTGRCMTLKLKLSIFKPAKANKKATKD